LFLSLFGRTPPLHDLACSLVFLPFDLVVPLCSRFANGKDVLCIRAYANCHRLLIARTLFLNVLSQCPILSCFEFPRSGLFFSAPFPLSPSNAIVDPGFQRFSLTPMPHPHGRLRSIFAAQILPSPTPNAVVQGTPPYSVVVVFFFLVSFLRIDPSDMSPAPLYHTRRSPNEFLGSFPERPIPPLVESPLVFRMADFSFPCNNSWNIFIHPGFC